MLAMQAWAVLWAMQPVSHQWSAQQEEGTFQTGPGPKCAPAHHSWSLATVLVIVCLGEAGYMQLVSVGLACPWLLLLAVAPDACGETPP
jgi:hypothetical protein